MDFSFDFFRIFTEAVDLLTFELGLNKYLSRIIYVIFAVLGYYVFQSFRSQKKVKAIAMVLVTCISVNLILIWFAGTEFECLSLNKKTRFFTPQGEALYYYCEIPNTDEICLTTYKGFHPVYRIPLQPVDSLIVQKYFNRRQMPKL